MYSSSQTKTYKRKQLSLQRVLRHFHVEKEADKEGLSLRHAHASQDFIRAATTRTHPCPPTISVTADARTHTCTDTHKRTHTHALSTVSLQRTPRLFHGRQSKAITNPKPLHCSHHTPVASSIHRHDNPSRRGWERFLQLAGWLMEKGWLFQSWIQDDVLI